MYNIEIRQAILKNRLKHFEVAEMIGVSATTFSVWLRRELPAEKKQLVMEAIEKLARGVTMVADDEKSRFKDMPHWNAFVEKVLADRQKPPQAERRGIGSNEQTKNQIHAKGI